MFKVRFIINAAALLAINLFGTTINAVAVSNQVFILNGSDSPNKEYRFVLIRTGKDSVGTLSYALLKISTGKALLKVLSAFQSLGTDDSRAQQIAQKAKVYWSSDSKCFVLSEATHNFMGNSILGMFSENEHKITSHTFVPADLGIDGLINWRIQVNHGWLNPTTLSMDLIGVYSSASILPDKQFIQPFTCRIRDDTNFCCQKQIK